MDHLKHLGGALVNAKQHVEALEVEERLRNIRVSVLGWRAPETLESCRRVATRLAALARHADAIGRNSE
jgi:hypothetical protein